MYCCVVCFDFVHLGPAPPLAICFVSFFFLFFFSLSLSFFVCLFVCLSYFTSIRKSSRSSRSTDAFFLPVDVKIVKKLNVNKTIKKEQKEIWKKKNQTKN